MFIETAVKPTMLNEVGEIIKAVNDPIVQLLWQC
jgi:hypothetical protein